MASNSTERAVQSVNGVTSSARETKQEADRVLMASDTLSSVTNVLTSSVDAFLKAVSDDLEERRRASRYTTDMRIDLIVNGQRISTHARNISSLGLLVPQAINYPANTPISIDLGDGPVSGKIAWKAGGETGITFNKALEKLPIGNGGSRIERHSRAA